MREAPTHYRMQARPYIFERDTNTGKWKEVQKIVASDRSNYDYFGYSVGISGDYAIVGAYGEDHDTSGSNLAASAGSAYIFERDAGTGKWKEVQKIVASDRESVDFFSWSVSISGNYAIAGAYKEDEDTSGSNTASSAGSAYLFERDTATGHWKEVQKIVASDRGSDDRFGISVSISGDYIIVGANQEDHDASGSSPAAGAGSAYIFELDTSTGKWQETQKIVASDRASSDEFGYSVSISGKYAIVGAYREEQDASGSNTTSDAGSAYIFEAEYEHRQLGRDTKNSSCRSSK